MAAAYDAVFAPAATEALPPYLSLVIPAYDEERRLGPTLDRIIAYLQFRPYTSEVIVVSDGSTDGTVAVAEAALSALPPGGRVTARVHGYSPNAGKGRAVREGVIRTRGRFVAFTDADLSTPIEEIERALAVLDRDRAAYRIVIGSRAVAGADVRRAQPLYRRLSARCFNLVRDRLAGIRGLKDTQCGLKVFEGALARAIFRRQRIDGFMFDVETMYIAQRLGIPILELGVRWEDVPESKVRLVSGFRLIPDLLRIRFAHRHLTPADAVVPPASAMSAPALGTTGT